jgi:hypothetical protein
MGKKVFEDAGMTAFIASCTEERAFDSTEGYAMIFSEADRKIIGKWATNPTYEFTIELFTKDSTQEPLSVVNEWYAKLTSEQQHTCEIQNADQSPPLLYEEKSYVNENPYPTSHKKRYKIAIKPEIIKQIWDEYGGDPGGGAERDYMCGHLVGTTWGGHPPYCEFDDRSPDKYLFVGAYGDEGPMIDLNSIRF